MSVNEIIAFVESRVSYWKRQEERAREKGQKTNELIYKSFRIEAENTLANIKGED